MNFATLKGLAIPEGNVQSIAIGGQTMWTKPVDKVLTWEAVFASIDAGTYASVYEIGDMIPLDLGTEGIVNMQIAAFDADDLSDGSGKAPISWISKELLKTIHIMNAKNTSGLEGTGAIGGWEKCELRAYLRDTIKPIIPDIVLNRIAVVAKTQPSRNTAGATETQTTNDDVWIPSKSEVSGASSLYYPLFQGVQDNRIKSRTGGATSASEWWLRSPADSSYFDMITATGGLSNRAAQTSLGIALGFCT